MTTEGHRRWWDGRVGYEIYVPSFVDGNGDGPGDLSGVRSRSDHLQLLGVDLLWLTPFYLSPQRDQGYDVADHCAVDPRYGGSTTSHLFLPSSRPELEQRGASKSSNRAGARCGPPPSRQ